MTLPGEIMLFVESDYDRSVDAIFEMAAAVKSDEIAAFAKQLGIASIRKLYSWANNHLQAGTGVEIEWKKDKTTKARLFKQLPQLEALKSAIAATSDEREEVVELSGELVGLDVDTRRFHMKIPEVGDIKGDVAPIIGTKHTLELPKHYAAEVRVKRKIYFATEREDVSYFLLKLK